MNPSTSVLHSATASVAGIDVLVVVVAVVVVAVIVVVVVVVAESLVHDLVALLN
jgi:hypothetical protein